MSHSVVITQRQVTTTTSSSAIIVNTGYLKTLPGLLKLAQLILGAVCVGIIGKHIDTQHYLTKPEVFFALMTVTFMIGTFCLLLSCLISFATSSIIAKTIYEGIYHCVAFILYFAAALTLLIDIQDSRRSYNRDMFMAASIIGLVVAALYLVSTVFAFRSYRGL